MPIQPLLLSLSRFAAILSVCVAIAHAGDTALPTGNAVIRGEYAGADIVITTTERLAGAIHSLTWNGQEYIDSHDHGRQLQSASNLDTGRRMYGETFNPTEAGSRSDGAGETSTSQLLHLVARDNCLQTTSRMAFWLRPGEESGGHPARNTTTLSDHLLTKRVTIGYRDMPNVIQYDVTFGIPVSEHHTLAQFEAVTGYMPASFKRFQTIDLSSGELHSLTDGPGEQSRPVIFSTASGLHAMGIYSPQQPSSGFENAGYGRWRFASQKVVKWNCVFRIRRQEGVSPGDYSFRSYVVVGTLSDVAATIMKLGGKSSDD